MDYGMRPVGFYDGRCASIDNDVTLLMENGFSCGQGTIYGISIVFISERLCGGDQRTAH